MLKFAASTPPTDTVGVILQLLLRVNCIILYEDTTHVEWPGCVSWLNIRYVQISDTLCFSE